MSWSFLWILGFFAIYLLLGTKLMAQLLMWAILGAIIVGLMIGQVGILLGTAAGALGFAALYRFQNGRQPSGQSAVLQ